MNKLDYKYNDVETSGAEIKSLLMGCEKPIETIRFKASIVNI